MVYRPGRRWQYSPAGYTVIQAALMDIERSDFATINGRLFSYIDLEKRIREDHPLRVIRAIANVALKSLSGEFEKLYSPLASRPAQG